MMTSFGDNFEQALKEAKLGYETLSSFATPRRLAIIVKKLDAAQAAQVIDKRGPSLKVAYDDQGNPSKAALGFMASCGIDDISQLDELQTDKGSWLLFRQNKPGLPLADLVSDLISNSIAGLPIARKMRWGSSRAEFVRPVHWLVVLYGKDVLDVELLNVCAGNKTYGHRFMSRGPVTLKHPVNYVEALQKAFVVADFSTRKQLIVDQLNAINKVEQGTVVADEDLLDEVTALVEWPVALTGKFQSRFLNVPEEALVSAMKSHQRYFHMIDQDGRLQARFVTIANIQSTNPDTVIRGNERVIAPRLSDADFFFNQDRKTSLEAKLTRLDEVVFQSKLGSYRQKAQRISELAGFVASQIDADREAAIRAGLLCKADLVSDMVIEFPELQGVMGSYYAKHDGESADVCSAIREHYLPTASGGDLPESLAGQCLSIADKADTLVGLFGIGQPPSGSRDPFALRRQALGILRICIESKHTLSVRNLVNEAVRLHDQDFDGNAVIAYLIERLGTWYQDLGIRFDTFDAVRHSSKPIDNLEEADGRIRSLQRFRSHARADNLIAANKRPANILKGADVESLPEVNPSLFEVEAERTLFTALGFAKQELAGAASDEARFLVLADLQSHIDLYFDDVMVMAENSDLKNNRLATLHNMRGLFLSVADLSVLQ